MLPLRATRQVVDKPGGRIFLANRETGGIVRTERKGGITIRFYDKLPCLSDSCRQGRGTKARPCISVSQEILSLAEQISPSAARTLYRLALDHEKDMLSGTPLERALENTAARLHALPLERRTAALELLKSDQLDPGNVLHDYLAAFPSAVPAERARLAALVSAQALVDIPYDRQRAQEADQQFAHDLPALRAETLQILATTYDPAVDRENARRVFAHCLRSGRRLVVCRFGRAFYTDALLIANSRALRGRELRGHLPALEQAYRPLMAFDGGQGIGAEFQRLQDLAAREWFSQADIEGALEKLLAALRRLEAACVHRSDRSLQLDEARAARPAIDRFRDGLYRLGRHVRAAETFDPTYVCFISRIHELDAINVVRVNELLDPFFGENPKIETLIRGAGHNTTISPNPGAWLPYASDWVEALPAYAHYTIVPQEGGYTVVAVTEREVLEIVYKTCADDWARNIEDAMEREVVAVARQLVAQRRHCASEDEEKLIRFIRSEGRAEEVAALAALIEQKAWEQHGDIARLQAAGRTRREALAAVCGSLRAGSGGGARAARFASLALEPSRPLPTVHVLTTLGPTETETNIANWLEEAMALYVIEARHGLADAVREKVGQYRAAVGTMALEAVLREHMEGELLRVMGEQGAEDTPENRARAAIRLAGLYPEIASQVNRDIARAWGHIGPEPHGLRDLVGPLATFTARREVAREKGLLGLLDDGRYRYASSGPYKRYHLAYTPSRVDLGPEIIDSVRNVPKWVGGDGPEAAARAKELYCLFNLAGVTAVDRPEIAEFLKVGENFFTRGGVYYLSLAAGANLNTLGMGDFEFLRGEWNRRGDRIVLPSGETYGGFCVPKEFSLLFAIVSRALNPKTVDELFDAFGVPADAALREQLVQDLLHALRLRRQFPDRLQWEEEVRSYLAGRHTASLPRAAQLALTLHKAGALDEDEEQRRSLVIANWKNKKALGMEEINRSGPFDKVRLIHLLVRQARQVFPQLSLDQLIGVVPAGYKEDVTDVRFSAGARKLELFAGLAKHLLQDIDPEGREIYGGVLASCPSPLDVRLVGLCTAKDMFGHVPMDFTPFVEEARGILRGAGYTDEWIGRSAAEHGVDLAAWPWKDPSDAARLPAALAGSIPFLVFGTTLTQISESVKRRLLSCGLSEQAAAANAATFGGDLLRWVGVTQADKERLLRQIGPARHVFVCEARGIYAKERYEAAVTDADFLDLGIPDRELLDLVDNLPKLVSLMKNGRDKPLLFADGTSGARRPAFAFRYASAKDKVKEVFALDDHCYYGCLGIGSAEILRWREEMRVEREDCRLLLAAVLEHRMEAASQIYARIAARLRLEEKQDEFLRSEIDARRAGVWKPYYRLASRRVSAVVAGAPLNRLDFGGLLVLGGRWLLSGKVSHDELAQIREDWAYALRQRGGAKETDALCEHCFRPKYVPAEEAYREVSTGVSGSLKAVEEAGLRMETLAARRRQLEEARKIASRRAAFMAEATRRVDDPEALYQQALASLSPDNLTQERFGALLAMTRNLWVAVTNEILPPGTLRNALLRGLDSTFRGGHLLDAEYAALERKGARLFETADPASANRVAQALELLDLALLIEKTMDVEDGDALWRVLARFFDATLNNHIFDYIPYHYHAERTHAFQDWSRPRLIALAVARHAFLHRFILGLLARHGALAGRSPAEIDLLIGRFDPQGELVAPPIAVDVPSPDEQRWFSYCRLRDLATLHHDGYPLPQVREGVQLPDGVTIGIVYPIGNTTVCVALEQGPRLAAEGVNLILTPFPRIVQQDGRKRLVARELFCRDRDGTWVLGRTAEDVVIHAIWFHFTHFLRPEIEKVGAPIIQPLLWEAATYLKCALPEMLKGSGVSCPDQRNWYRRQTEQLSFGEARRRIQREIREMARRHRVLIVKAEKESGGRRSKILPVAGANGNLIEPHIQTLADLVYDISHTDNAVIQEVIPCKVRRLYTPAFLGMLRERFITELGIGMPSDTPLFSYFRMIVMKKPDGSYTITHRITVVSTAGVANVGQGGRLFEYRDEKINPEFRDDLRAELERAAIASLKAQEQFIRDHRRGILESYCAEHPEFQLDGELFDPHVNALGRPDHEILFEMGDYMPVFLTDDQGTLLRLYVPEAEAFVPLTVRGSPHPQLRIYDGRGELQKPPVQLIADGTKRDLVYQYRKGPRRPVRSLAVVKIEPNPGAGLWRPHNDRLKLVGRDGEGVLGIFRALGEWGALYRNKIM